MATQKVPISLEDNTEFHNIFKNDVMGRYVRPVRTAHHSLSAFPSGNTYGQANATKIVYAFSIESSITTEVYHYVVYNNGVLYCYNEEFQELWRLTISVNSSNGLPDASSGSFSHAVYQNQFVLNSEFLSGPVFGFVGGGVILATKVDSLNPDTTALDLLPGGVAVFGDRFVYSYQNQILISDPEAARTITAANVISFEGKVLDMFQAGPNGNFYVCTTNGIYVLPADGLTGQQSYAGFISHIRDYEGTQLRNMAYSKGTIFGLVDNGVWDVNNSENIELVKNRRSRYISKAVGNFIDMRYGRIFSYENGFIISVGNTSLLVDIVNKFSTWITTATSNYTQMVEDSIVGVLKTRDGKSIFASPTAIWEFSGNIAINDSLNMYTNPNCDYNYSGSNVIGIACKQLETPPDASPVIREMTVSADNHNFSIKTYIKNSIISTTTLGALGGVIIGTSLWDNSGSIYFKERNMRSSRHKRAVRGDSLDIEVGVEGALSRLNSNVTIVLNGQGNDRPSI